TNEHLKSLNRSLNDREKRLYRQFLHDASEDLSFSEDVMWERGAGSVHDSKAHFRWLFRATGPLGPLSRRKIQRDGAHRQPHKKSREMAPLHPSLQITCIIPLTPKDCFTLLSHQETTSDVNRTTGQRRVSLISSDLKEIFTENWEDWTNDSYWDKSAVKTLISTTVQSKQTPRQNDLARVSEPEKKEDIGVDEFGHHPSASAESDAMQSSRATMSLLEYYGQHNLNPRSGARVSHTKNDRTGRMKTGSHRWVNVPAKADHAAETTPEPADHGRKEMKVPKQRHGYEPMSEKALIHNAMEEWRNAWKIKCCWQSATIGGLRSALTDLHSYVRLQAIVSCALGAVNRPGQELGLDRAGESVCKKGRSWKMEAVPPELKPLLLSALNDPVKQVQVAAAVCQYAAGMPNDRAREILRDAILQDSVGTGADSCVAAQCLAMEGDAGQEVIQRLVSQHFFSDSRLGQTQTATLLSNISSKATLVRSLLAEKLNCTSWRTRLLACGTIALLKCSINKDVVNKLIFLMWNDLRAEVRQVAAQALLKLGMDAELYNELRAKLEDGPNSLRVEALILIGQLRIMKAKLLSLFLNCFKDVCMAVRHQACLTAETLEMKHPVVLKRLTELMQNDFSGQVKAAAIQALGKIGQLSSTLQELLLRALDSEGEPRVRTAACQAIKSLHVKGPELERLLLERFELETNPVVRRHIKELIKSSGYSPEGDSARTLNIKNQVRDGPSRKHATQ
ncbi:HEAT repeat-containing protein 4, partial [Chanos chanos]|uniref:HEAT repeat-containing protein 4 n=1 Tax=Chanos chanos TaxID=29144 RepID=A0A6J2WBR0_CHACN